MHLQIRKKEKYLLISMICYLLVISSALLLIFSPVSGYTLLQTLTINHQDYTDWFSTGQDEFSTMNIVAFKDNVTHVVITGQGYSTNQSGSYSNTLKMDTGAHNIGTYTATWDFAKGASPSGAFTLTLDFSVGDILEHTGPRGLHLEGLEEVLGTVRMVGSYENIAHYTTDQNTVYIKGGQYSTPIGNVYNIYGGTSVPDAPVINNVTSFPSCLEPGTGVVLESNVTGTVDDWTWEIYDQSDTSVFTGSSPIEQMVDLYLLSPGDYNVQLTVENAGGNDFWQQDDFLHINQSGTCNFTVYDPFPTVSVTPTIQVYPTLTLPSIIDTNMTGINTEIDELWIIGNMSEGYREMVDYYGEGVNTTFTGLVGIIVSPFTFIANAVSTGSTLFSTSYTSLMSYTTVPLAIVGITLSYYPWQIITLITAGIAIDAVFVLIFGVR